jgi:hypothetical protein
MDDFESRALTAQQVESALKDKYPKIFEDFDLLRIREAIIQVINEVHPEKPADEDRMEQGQDDIEDSWSFKIPDDLPDRIVEILESDKGLTEKIKSVFYIALVNGHMDRASQLRDTFRDINFDKEIEDAFNDACASNRQYLPKEIAKLHTKSSYEELLAIVKDRSKQ